MAIGTYGMNAVDWEERIDLDRLRRQRLARLSEALEALQPRSGARVRLPNIRYMTATHIGTWAMDKFIRFALLCRGRGADRVGLRVGGPPPPAVQPLAGRSEAGARRHLGVARRVPPRRRHRRGAGPQDCRRAVRAGAARCAGRHRHRRDARAPRAAAGRHRRGRRTAALPRGPADQDPGRDLTAHPGMLHGGRRLRGAVRVPAPGRQGERVRGPGQQGALRPRQRVRRGRQCHLR